MTTRGQFKLHLPGLLKILAEHLYSSQRIGVRELIQNSHDSCVRRAVEQPDDSYHPRIDIQIDEDARILRFVDNGSGLTEEEIHHYLTVIGRGYTRELRKKLSVEDPSKSQQLVGQFGIGFLSAFLLATEVTVETRSSSGPALRWFSAGDEEFELSPGSRLETGTTVELRLKSSAYFLLREQRLLDTVREFADFLPIEIHVQGMEGRANLGSPPWDEPDEQAACRNYVKRRFGEADPLVILPLTDGVVDLGHDTITIPLRGLLFVPAQSVVSVKEYGTVAVSIRGMAICDSDKDLLPPWARFVRGVIDCPALQPTASREAVHQDDTFEAVRQIIVEQLSDGLRRLARWNPAIWRKIAHGHDDVILGWAPKDSDFFRMVADSVPLRSSRGRITLPEYLRLSGNIIYYTTRELGSLQEKILAEGRDVPVIDASWFGVASFIRRYTEYYSEVGLVQLDDDLETLMHSAPAEDFHELIQLCEELGFTAVASSFGPIDLPAVMTYPSGAESARDAKSALEQGLLPEGFSTLMQDFLDTHVDQSKFEGTLYINVACPLIQRLTSAELPIARKQAALSTIAYFAKLFCGRMLDASLATNDLGVWCRSLEKLI